MTRIALRVTLALSVPLVFLTAAPTPAGATHKIGPNQYFTGVVNGTDGNTIVPIPIHMACFGPLIPGETGHPLDGQTLAVHELFPPTAATTLGKTGKDSTIDVFFGAPPPAAIHALTSRSAATTVSFSRYDKTKALPTSLTLPCGGAGTVWFVPIPVVPPSQAEAVQVQFEPQP
jgi:hypothetical protein